nr:unnamed protein product [Amyelois transitella]
MDEESETWCWQLDGGELYTVLHAVFAWLSGGELAASGAACRAWRRAARDPLLWRRLLRRRGVAHDTLCALRQHCPTISWRQEYVNVCASWNLVARVPAATESGAADGSPQCGGGPLAHAALDSAGGRLALAGEDATFSIWVRKDNEWQEEWSSDLRTRGWSGVVRSEWAQTGPKAPAAGSRLLVTGALALADRWELLVLQRDECGAYRCMSRAGCGAGAGGCWAAAGAFLSLELCRLARRLALTVVWLNAATQETQSEYAGVTSPLLRVFNEDSAHLTHALVADVPLDAMRNILSNADDSMQSLSPGSMYYLASIKTCVEAEDSVQTLVTASHGPGGALRAWAVSARRPPPLLAAGAGSLAARALRRRHAAGAAPPGPAEPDEAAVRAMCDPPDAECYLHSAVLGLVLNSSNRCIWASTADGRAWCLSLPSLTRLCALPGASGACPGEPYYLQPAASARYVAAPGGGRGGAVRLCGAPCPRPPPPDAGPALACLLPPRENELLVLAGHYVHIWRNQATQQSE